MTQRLYSLFFVAGVVAVLVSPFTPFVFAQQFKGDEGPSGIVPCGDDLDGNGLVDYHEQCRICHLGQLADQSLKFAVYISVFVATLLIMYAGFLYITAGGDPKKISDATSTFGKVIVGIIIVLTAWLVIDTIMTNFFNNSELNKKNAGENSSFYPPWSDICAPGDFDNGRINFPEEDFAEFPEEEEGIVDVGEPQGPQGGVDPSIDPGLEGTLSHNLALERLNAAGVQVTATGNNPIVQANCSGPGCTSLEGAQSTTVQQVIYIKEACGTGCLVQITGFTESGAGHQPGEISHGSGAKVDIDNTPAIDAWFRQNLIRDGSRSGDHGGPRYRDGCGNEYVFETNYSHWDISVNRACSFGI